MNISHSIECPRETGGETCLRSHVRPLRTSGARPPLFCFFPGPPGARDMAEFLPEDQPVSIELLSSQTRPETIPPSQHGARDVSITICKHLKFFQIDFSRTLAENVPVTSVTALHRCEFSAAAILNSRTFRGICGRRRWACLVRPRQHVHDLRQRKSNDFTYPQCLARVSAIVSIS